MKENFLLKNKKIIVIIYLILLISWLYFIFSNSLATASESSAQSNRVVEISQKIVSVFDKDAIVKPSAIRTSAHFLEFFVLGALYYLGTYFFENRNHFFLMASVSLSLFTALVDETLQLNVSGRGAEVTDVWVDFLGAMFAHAIIVFILLTVRRLKKK